MVDKKLECWFTPKVFVFQDSITFSADDVTGDETKPCVGGLLTSI
ncbi:MAG: hypothetical protein P1U34_12595 [Coxiellaceae bacterium]|nr:hypothetical protein [Coxiellaceae bacterium]